MSTTGEVPSTSKISVRSQTSRVDFPKNVQLTANLNTYTKGEKESTHFDLSFNCSFKTSDETGEGECMYQSIMEQIRKAPTQTSWWSPSKTEASFHRNTSPVAFGETERVTRDMAAWRGQYTLLSALIT